MSNYSTNVLDRHVRRFWRMVKRVWIASFFGQRFGSFKLVYLWKNQLKFVLKMQKNGLPKKTE